MYLTVILEEGDQNSLTNEMDLVTVAIPFHQTDTTIHLMTQIGVNGIAEFTVSYDIYCNSDPNSNPDPCQIPFTSIFTNPTYSTSCTFCSVANVAIRQECYIATYTITSNSLIISRHVLVVNDDIGLLKAKRILVTDYK